MTRRTSSRRPDISAWNTALCSESTGSTVACAAAARRMNRSPAQTKHSLLAMATVAPRSAAASVGFKLAAPVIAQAATPTTKATAGATSAVAVKTIKADKTALKHRKHARRHNGTHMAKHMHKNGVKHVRHFNKGNGHKVAGTANKVVSAKPATRSGNN